jgi:hypothetical protein
MSTPVTPSDAAPAGAIVAQMARAHRQTKMVYAAAELGLADLLAAGPRGADDLAATCGAHAPSLRRLLRALAAFGLFTEGEDGRFALTAEGERLRSDVPGSLRATALQSGGAIYAVWGEFLQSIRTGGSAFERVYGMPEWEYNARHPEVGARFDAYMVAQTSQATPALLAAYDFAPFGTVVDVGGGHGTFLAAILAAHPGARGVLFDQPHVVAGADAVLAAAGVGDRCRIVGGDFFADAVAGGDAYVLMQILHDWDDARATAILANLRRAVPPTGRLLVVERLLPDQGAISPAHRDIFAVDLNMLAYYGGAQERTTGEFRALFAAAGFTLTGITPTSSAFHVIEGVPA